MEKRLPVALHAVAMLQMCESETRDKVMRPKDNQTREMPKAFHFNGLLSSKCLTSEPLASFLYQSIQI